MEVKTNIKYLVTSNLKVENQLWNPENLIKQTFFLKT